MTSTAENPISNPYVSEMPFWYGLDHKFWNDLYEECRARRDGVKSLAYGIRVPVTYNPRLYAIWKEHPGVLETFFYFLLTNRKRNIFPIHVGGAPTNPNIASLNWPIRNCGGESKTTWYKVLSEEKRFVHGNSVFLDPSVAVEPIYEYTFETSKPLTVLFRSDIWHKGENKTGKSDPRLIVKWETNFKSWEEAVEYFKIRA